MLRACTYLNAAAASVCEVCDTAAPGDDGPLAVPAVEEEEEAAAAPMPARRRRRVIEDDDEEEDVDAANAEKADAGLYDPSYADENVCGVCGGSTLREDGTPCPDTLLCDDCEGEVHLGCSGLEAIPEGDYFCAACAAFRARDAAGGGEPLGDEGLFDDEEDEDGGRDVGRDVGGTSDDEAFFGVFSQKPIEIDDSDDEDEDPWTMRPVDSDDDSEVVDLTTDQDVAPASPRGRRRDVEDRDDVEEMLLEDDIDEYDDLPRNEDHPDDVSGALSGLAETFRSVRWLEKKNRMRLNFDDLLVDERALKAGLKRITAAREKRAREGPPTRRGKPKKARKAGGGRAKKGRRR